MPRYKLRPSYQGVTGLSRSDFSWRGSEIHWPSFYQHWHCLTYRLCCNTQVLMVVEELKLHNNNNNKNLQFHCFPATSNTRNLILSWPGTVQLYQVQNYRFSTFPPVYNTLYVILDSQFVVCTDPIRFH